MDPNGFETIVKLNEREIEVIGNVFVQHFLKNPSEPDAVSPQSALLQKILDARHNQIIEARAAGRL